MGLRRGVKTSFQPARIAKRERFEFLFLLKRRNALFNTGFDVLRQRKSAFFFQPFDAAGDKIAVACHIEQFTLKSLYLRFVGH